MDLSYVINVYRPNVLLIGSECIKRFGRSLSEKMSSINEAIGVGSWEKCRDKVNQMWDDEQQRKVEDEKRKKEEANMTPDQIAKRTMERREKESWFKKDRWFDDGQRSQELLKKYNDAYYRQLEIRNGSVESLNSQLYANPQALLKRLYG